MPRTSRGRWGRAHPPGASRRRRTRGAVPSRTASAALRLRSRRRTGRASRRPTPRPGTAAARMGRRAPARPPPAAPPSSTSCAAARPRARLPTWSWFWAKPRKRAQWRARRLGGHAGDLDVASNVPRRPRPCAARDQVGEAGEVLVVAIALARERGVQRVVEVVAPLGVDAVATKLPGTHDARVVEVALGDEHEFAAEARAASASTATAISSSRCVAVRSMKACTASMRKPSMW